MKVNNPIEIKFPFNVNSEYEYIFMVNRLEKLGYKRISIGNKIPNLPIRFLCMNNNPNNLQYLIY